MTQPRMIGDRYELGELIGYGGMAEVHRGRDTRLNRDVAIKVLRADLARDPAFLTRFRREAHSAAGLNHPAIVSVYDTGESTGPDGTAQPFIVMEFVAGRTLRDIVKSEGSLPARRAMEITADICGALDFSHRNGIVHRDIKPANVMITPQGAVKVMDFGIARAVADSSATVTQTANVIGTAQYLSPEQARGESVDARSDVYSTGCLLYELVTGVPPFQGDSPVAVAYQHVRENPVMPSARKPDIPRVLDSIVMKALAKNQLNRYQSAGDMRSDLQRALANQPVNAEAVMTDAERTQFIARTPPPVAVARRDEYVDEPEDGHRKTGLIWAAVVVALVLVIGIATAVILLGGGSGSDKVSVPTNLQGMTQAAAEDAITKAGLIPKLGPVTTGQCTDTSMAAVDGRVCTIEPAPGASVDKNSSVTIALYSKPAPQAIQLPDVTMQQLDAAEQTLSAKGISEAKGNLVIKRVYELDQNGDAKANEVVRQSPEAYANLQPGSKLTIYVATGKLIVPKVVGKSEDDAKSALSAAGLNNINPSDRYDKTTDQSKDGMVSSIDPVAGSKIDPDRQITLTIYKYEPPSPTCVTTTPPSTPASSPVLPGQSTATTPTTETSTGLPPCQ